MPAAPHGREWSSRDRQASAQRVASATYFAMGMPRT